MLSAFLIFLNPPVVFPRLFVVGCLFCLPKVFYNFLFVSPLDSWQVFKHQPVNIFCQQVNIFCLILLVCISHLKCVFQRVFLYSFSLAYKRQSEKRHFIFHTKTPNIKHSPNYTIFGAYCFVQSYIWLYSHGHPVL